MKKAAAQIKFDELKSQIEYQESLENESALGYKYVAFDSNKVRVAGTFNDKRLEEVDSKLNRAGMKIESIAPRSLGPVQTYKRSRRTRPSNIEMAQLAEQLGDLLVVLPSPRQACSILARTTSKQAISTALEGAAHKLYQGDSISESFAAQKDDKGRDFFPPTFLYALRIGEEIAALPDPEDPNGKSVAAYYLLLRFFSEAAKKAHATTGKIRNAMTYPAVISIACFAAFLIEVYVIMPMMTPLFQGLLQGKDDSLPLLTQIMIDVGAFFASAAGVLALLIFIAAVAFAVYWLFFVPQGIDWRERKMLKLPRFGSFYRDYNASQTSRTLAMVWEGKSDLKERFAIARDTTTHPQYREMLNHILRELTISAPELPELFAPYDHLMGEEFASTIQTVQTTGMGQTQFYSYAKVLEQRADEKLDSTIAFLQQVSIILPAAFVIFILLASYMPLFSLIGKLAGK